MKHQIYIILWICCPFFLYGQENISENRFEAAVLLGITASQIDGDGAAGYHKVGLTGGLRSFIHLNKKAKLGIDLLYSQRGSRTVPTEADIQRTINLHYIEIPVAFNYFDWKSKDDEGNTFYKTQFSIGISYARLFSIKANEAFYSYSPFAPIDDYAKNDYSLFTGVTYFPKPHWGYSFRIAKSVNFLYDGSTGSFNDFRSHFLYIAAMYRF